MAKSVNEGSTAYLSVAFKDKNGLSAIPLTVSYRIDCLTNNVEIMGDSVITPAAFIEITITPTQNAIINNSNPIEQKRVTIKATYSATDKINDYYDFDVVNISTVV